MDCFIRPKSWTPNVQVLTTTRRYPQPVAGAVVWPEPTLAKGAAIEAAFNAHGCPLSALLPAPPLWLNQVHGNRVFDVDTVPLTELRSHPPDADAAVTHRPNTVLAIMTADCLPVVLADTTDSATGSATGSAIGAAIGAAHAGWRGLVGGVLEATVAALDVPAARLSAWLGPAIGPTAFEVGDDVRDAFLAVAKESNDANYVRATAACFVPATPQGKWFADLYALARLRLTRCGVTRISGGEHCTYRETQRFYSYRRAKDQGRMATFVWLGKFQHPEENATAMECGGLPPL